MCKLAVMATHTHTQKSVTLSWIPCSVPRELEWLSHITYSATLPFFKTAGCHNANSWRSVWLKDHLFYQWEYYWNLLKAPSTAKLTCFYPSVGSSSAEKLSSGTRQCLHLRTKQLDNYQSPQPPARPMPERSVFKIIAIFKDGWSFIPAWFYEHTITAMLYAF